MHPMAPWSFHRVRETKSMRFVIWLVVLLVVVAIVITPAFMGQLVISFAPTGIVLICLAAAVAPLFIEKKGGQYVGTDRSHLAHIFSRGNPVLRGGVPSQKGDD